MNFPCPSHVDCPGSDFPIENLSTELQDRPIYVCVWHGYRLPDIGGSNDSRAYCTVASESFTSDLDACINAYQRSLECIVGELVGNDAQTVTIECP